MKNKTKIADLFELIQKRGEYTSVGYKSVTQATFDGRSYSGRSGRQHMSTHRPNIIDQSRDFMRNNSIYNGMINRATSYICGNGFGLQVKSEDEDYNKEAEMLWTEFWQRPDVTQRLSGRQLLKMICSEVMTAGDTGIIKVDGGLVQLIEAEQIIGSKAQKAPYGFRANKVGKPTSWYVSPYSAGQVKTNKAKRYTPEQFLFVASPDRPSSTRGVPPCQSAFAMLHRINDVCNSEAIAWQILARLAISITKNGGAGNMHGLSRDDSAKSSEEQDGDLARRVVDIDYATIFAGEDGDEIKGIDRNIPGKDFPQSIEMFLRLMGLPLGMPLEITLLDWTESNYSQSRAVLEQAFETFLSWQYLLQDFSLAPIFSWKIDEWVLAGKLDKIETGKRHDWVKPTFPWIDQLKEAQAWGSKLDRTLTTHSIALKSENLDRGNVVAMRVKEVRDAIEQAQAIEKDFPEEKIPWEIFAGLQAPKTESEGTPTGKESKAEDE
jgi:capsid protein